MKSSVCLYVSGHGFGHAVRTAEIVRALVRKEPDLRIHIRTTAPVSLFRGNNFMHITFYNVSVDSGVVEEDNNLRINGPATCRTLKDFLDRADEIVAREVDFIQRENVGLIVADIPYLAGEIGWKAGIPSAGISNFTWDWILEPLLEREGALELLTPIERGYAKMDRYLQLPFGHSFTQRPFARGGRDLSPGEKQKPLIIEVPLVAGESRVAEKVEIRKKALVSAGESRTLVFLGMRAPLTEVALSEVARKNPDCLFLHAQQTGSAFPENTRFVTFGEELTFHDLMTISDVVVSKLGYGMVSACVATGTDILFPTRHGFREDEVLSGEIGRYVRAKEIPRSDYDSGNWSEHLRALLALPRPSNTMRTDGAELCAENLIGMLHPRRDQSKGPISSMLQTPPA